MSSTNYASADVTCTELDERALESVTGGCGFCDDLDEGEYIVLEIDFEALGIDVDNVG